MTLIVDLSPSEEARLRRAARERGVPPEELARQLIAELPADDTVPRVSDELRNMGRMALREHAAGRTEEFPV
jgi:hypothetical protein